MRDLFIGAKKIDGYGENKNLKNINKVKAKH